MIMDNYGSLFVYHGKLSTSFLSLIYDCLFRCDVYVKSLIVKEKSGIHLVYYLMQICFMRCW